MERLNHRFEVLDVFRGIAAIIVAIFHYTIKQGDLRNVAIIANGHRFVDFFFVLSGFIIFSKYQDINSWNGVLRFSFKRFLRLYPLHFFMLICFLLFECGKAYLYRFGYFNNPAFTTNSWNGFVQNVFMLQGFEVSSKDFTWNYPSWSISVEFFNYLLFALIVWVTNRFFVRINFLILVMVIVLSLVLLNSGVVPFLHFFLRCTYGFFFGGIIYIIYTIKTISSIPNRWTGLVELMVLIVTIVIICYLPEKLNLILTPIYGIVILIFAKESGIISEYLKNPFMILIGKLSYSIYMVHALVASVLIVLFCNLLKVNFFLYDLSTIIFLLIVLVVSYFVNKYVENKGVILIKTKES